MHFSALVSQNVNTLESLIRYGCDTLFPRLNWVDRVAIMDLIGKLEVDYMDRVFLKIALEVLKDSYQSIVGDLNLEAMIQMIS